jgi:hypothetical protein
MPEMLPINGKHDVWTHRIVVGTIGLTTLGATIGIVCLSSAGHDVPASLPIIASAALGSLSSMLVNIMKGND